MRCLVCGKKYNPKEIQKFYFRNKKQGNGKIQSVRRIRHHGEMLNLCNTCFRLTMVNICIQNHYDIIDRYQND